MIVPKVSDPRQRSTSRSLSIFEQNWVFGQQWQAVAPADRVILEIPINAPLSTFELAMRIAAVTARKGRRIILSTGHGATEVGNNPAAFDTIPESGRMKTHKHMITSEVFDLPDIATRTPQGWVAKLPPGVRSDSAAQAKVDALAPQFDMLERIGRILKQRGVRQFIVLSCMVGAGSAFGSQLAGRLQTSVGLYRDLVVMRDVVFDGPRALKVQAFTVPPDERANADRFAPDPSDRDHRSFSEIPSGASRFSP